MIYIYTSIYIYMTYTYRIWNMYVPSWIRLASSTASRPRTGKSLMATITSFSYCSSVFVHMRVYVCVSKREGGREKEWCVCACVRDREYVCMCGWVGGSV